MKDIDIGRFREPSELNQTASKNINLYVKE